MRPIAIVGLGELGALFAQGFLRLGHPVYPVTRKLRAAEVARAAPDPELVLVAVGESDLDRVLAELPPSFRARVGLLQNELLPRVWLAHGIERPTVTVVWFEKKPTTLVKQLARSVVAGPKADLVAAALAAVGIGTRRAAEGDELTLELVKKNLYILTTNIAGLETKGTVGELWSKKRELAERVARDVLVLQARLCGADVPEAELLASLAETVQADPEHPCTGRTAPARLERALADADKLGLAVPELRRIARVTGAPA